jgi:hypothetical protein
LISLSTPVGDGPISRALKIEGCDTLAEAAAYVTELPYGRTVSNSPLSVIVERVGTCSSKHAVFALLCREVKQPAKLMIGYFNMCEATVPGVGQVLESEGLAFILEAHCYIQLPDGDLDLTGLSTGCGDRSLHNCQAIEPERISEKTQLHKFALDQWRAQHAPKMSLDQLWAVRERCIAALSA